MEKEKTYIIVCRRGLHKNKCPYVIQGGIHCVDCDYAGYILREKIKEKDNEDKEANHD